MKNVKIYTTQTCHYCKDVKNFLDENKIPYTTLDVGKNLEARKEMVELSGQMGVPVTIIGEKIVIGFDKDNLKEALGLK